MLLSLKNKTFRNYADHSTPLKNNYLFSAMAGTFWYLQFIFYCMGENKMGNKPGSWMLSIAFIILLSNRWELGFSEWRGVNRKTFASILSGIGVIIYGNFLF